METWDAITSRRNVRQFADRPIDAPVLDRILEAGRRAPSSRNWQPWDFVLVTDREQLRELSTVGPGAFHAADAAAAVALVIEEYDDATVRERARYDVGQATMAMMIAAADQGVGSGHIGVQGPGEGARGAGSPRRPPRRLPARLRLPRRPPAGADPEPRPSAVRRGRAPRTVVGVYALRPPDRKLLGAGGDTCRCSAGWPRSTRCCCWSRSGRRSWCWCPATRRPTGSRWRASCCSPWWCCWCC